MWNLPGPQESGLDSRHQERPTLTRLHTPTCQAWPRSTGQASCTQGSVGGGWSFKEHAEAWTRDSSASRQVTLLFLMPVPQVTEHCRDKLSARRSPRGAMPTGQLEPYQPGLEGRWRSAAFLSLKSPERPSRCSEVTQVESIIFFYLYVYTCVSLCVCHLCVGCL